MPDSPRSSGCSGLGVQAPAYAQVVGVKLRAGMSSPDGQTTGWSGATPSPTKGVLGTSHPGKGSLRSAFGRPLPGWENPSPGKA